MEKIKIRVKKFITDELRVEFCNILSSHEINDAAIQCIDKYLYERFKTNYVEYINYTNYVISNIDNIKKYINNVATIDDVHTLFELMPYDIDPIAWYSYMTQETNSNSIIKPCESIHVCKKCHKNFNISFYKQDRSRDEGMTLHVICGTKGCNLHWKENA
jgi:DNA-directed RNA polymerase subunit M/transcription elongation factor TFIIS